MLFRIFDFLNFLLFDFQNFGTKQVRVCGDGAPHGTSKGARVSEARRGGGRAEGE
jgi:hypothetical protein